MGARKRFRIRTRDGTAYPAELSLGVPFHIGRGAGVAFSIPLTTVSRQHCKIELGEDGAFELHDLGSSSGTLLNGRSVKHAPLRDGDEIAVASELLKVEIEPPPLLDAEDRSAIDEALRGLLDEMGIEVLRRLDVGKAIPVYLARRTDIDQDVVLKAVRTGGDARADERAERLLREARVLVKLAHPSLAQIYDIRRGSRNLALVMEYVRGTSLAEDIARAGAVEVDRTLRLAIGVCRALEHAHENGIVHRDVTPAAVILASDGSVKLVNFGLVKSLTTAAGPKLTRMGQLLGTADYSAPEQIQDARKVDHRADIYGLGATLYHALSGLAPVEVAPAQGGDPNAPAPDPLSSIAPFLPGRVVALVERAMAPLPKDRFPSAAAMRAALTEAIAVFAPVSALDDAVGAVSTAIMGFRRTAALSGFVGRFKAGELADILEMAGKGRRTGFIEVLGPPLPGGVRLFGSISFQDGALLAAHAGDRTGTAALAALLSLPAGSFRVVYDDAREPEAGASPVPIPEAIAAALEGA